MNSDNSTFAKLTIIGMKGCEEITDKIDYYLKQFRKDAQAALQDAVYVGDECAVVGNRDILH